jgi:hypothetical protein
MQGLLALGWLFRQILSAYQWQFNVHVQKTKEQEKFIEEQLKDKIQQGWVSESFGLDLLPGMYSVPMHTVPKPNSDKLWLIVDHTAGDFSPNSMIRSDDIKGTKLDVLHSLGASLLEFR